MDTSEIISFKQSQFKQLAVTKGPEFNFGISHHSMIKYKTNAIIITGGLQNMNGSPFLAAKHSKETLIVDPTNKFEIKMGPPMNTVRTLHVSGKMVINNIVYVVVVGGVNHCDVSDKDQTLDSVELLDPSSEQGWFYGKLFLS